MKSKVAIVLVLLLVAVCLLAGCTSEYKCGAFGRHYMGPCFQVYSMYAGVKSDTNTFAKDDVTFDLYYGLYDIDKKENIVHECIHQYAGRDDDDFFFAIYVSVDTDALYIFLELEDYKNIENAYLIKEISCEEAISQNYGYKINKLSGLKYFHNEQITIPSEIFKSQMYPFYIAILLINTKKDQSVSPVVVDGYFLNLHYQMLDVNTVQISF